MIRGYKIRLLPTKEQEELMWKSVNYSRFVWNWALSRWNELYKENKHCFMGDIRKEFTQLKKQKEYRWLNEISSKTLVEPMRNLDKAFKLFFKGNVKYPKFRTKKKSKQNFYINYESLYFINDVCNIEKIGKIKYKTNYNIPQGRNAVRFMDTHCIFDGKYWYVTFCCDINESQVNIKNDLCIGIDLGIKELAVCSNGMVFKNINKTQKVKKINKKLKRLQRKCSKKYELNKQNNKFIKTNNIIKLEKQIKLIYRKLSNIRLNHIYQTINTILKENPSKIIMEDLNISGMLKNKHLSKSISEQCFYKFIEIIKYKCKWNNIEFVQADRFYPSSKTCSCCGNIKHNLKLKDRIYKCDKCGLEIDRDLNASINLMNYKLV